jgi:hypothetical protein
VLSHKLFVILTEDKGKSVNSFCVSLAKLINTSRLMMSCLTVNPKASRASRFSLFQLRQYLSVAIPSSSFDNSFAYNIMMILFLLARMIIL